MSEEPTVSAPAEEKEQLSEAAPATEAEETAE